jgi:hypothetical protein
VLPNIFVPIITERLLLCCEKRAKARSNFFGRHLPRQVQNINGCDNFTPGTRGTKTTTQVSLDLKGVTNAGVNEAKFDE